jgi:transposase
MSRIAGIVEAISAQGAQLADLPPYRPDLNPIEQALPSSWLRCAGPPSAAAKASGRPSISAAMGVSY